MPKQMLTLPEVLAMMEVAGIKSELRAKFNAQASAVLAKRPAFTDEDDRFEVASIYSSRSNEPHVNFKTGTVEHQLTVKKAREIASMLLEASEAALSDAIVMTWLKEHVGVTDEQRLGMMLLDLREIRQGSRDTVYPH